MAVNSVKTSVSTKRIQQPDQLNDLIKRQT